MARRYGTESREWNARTGRFVRSERCDCCGRACGTAHYTDDEVCRGGDGPGFYLCGRAGCGDRGNRNIFELPAPEREAHYTAQRMKNELNRGTK